MRAVNGELHRDARGGAKPAYQALDEERAYVARAKKLLDKHAKDIPLVFCEVVSWMESPHLTPGSLRHACTKLGDNLQEKYGRFDLQGWLHLGGVAESAMVLELALREAGDNALSLSARTKFLEGVASRRQTSEFRSQGGRGFFVDPPLPIQQWHKKTIAWAHAYAENHGLSGPLVEQLKAAAPSRLRCRWELFVVEKPSLGGGSYGKIRAGNQRLLERIDRDIKAGEDIDCAKIAGAKSDASLLALVRHEWRNPKLVLRAHYSPDFHWEVFRSYGRPTHMANIIKTYRQKADDEF